MIIDNYALSQYQTCAAKYKLAIIDSWRSRRGAPALDAGLVLHKGIETWYKTHELADALIAIRESWPAVFPVDDYRDLEKVLTTMRQYTQTYTTENWHIIGSEHGEPMIEQSFTLPTGMYLDLCPECKHDNSYFKGRDPLCAYCNSPLEPIEYGGIFDMLVEFAGQVYVVDHKTTSMMGQYYFNQYKPNNQMTGYIWAGGQLSGRRVGGAIINAIGWFRKGATKFERQITSRTPLDLTNWLDNVRQTANMLRRSEVLGEFPMNTNACTMYGRCTYKDVHELDDPAMQLKLLDRDFVVKVWNHEARDDDVTE